MTHVLNIKLMCTLSFTFEGNCGTNLKALLEYMNRQYFFPFYTKIKKKKVKFQNLIFFVVGVWLDDFPYFFHHVDIIIYIFFNTSMGRSLNLYIPILYHNVSKVLDGNFFINRYARSSYNQIY